MSKKLWLVLPVILTATMLLTACSAAPVQPTTTPAAAAAAVQPTTAAPTAALVQPTIIPAATVTAPTTAAALLDDSSIKVGLVTDARGVNDHAFNQLAWEGVQKASEEMGFQAKFIESTQPTDYENNIDALATEGYNVIITVGPLMADATALKAKQYPNIRFAIIDHAYIPTNSSQYCDFTVIDCYSDGGLTNVTSLMFAEGQVGFLAGVLAGGMSRSGFVCSVSAMQIPPLERYVRNFYAGAIWQAGTNMNMLNNYIPSVTDPTQGKETALSLIGQGCDVVFAVGGVAVNGALLAAKEKNLPAIGADVDQYNTNPEVQSALISSAMKNVDVAVYNHLKTVVDGYVKAGISTGTLQNGGVGLAPFHDWDSQIPADLKAHIQRASDGIKDGSITIDLP